MTQLAILIDLDKCIGCHSCTVACQVENGLALGTYWSKVRQIGPVGTFPDLEMYYLPVLCQHCGSPECTRVCPTGASAKREDGIVLVDRDRCIGCQYCVLACPYGVRTYSPEEGVIEKCTMCAHLIERGDIPACVKTCTGKARYFGDLDDPNSEISVMIREAGEFVHSLVDVGNKPSVHYILRRGTWRS
jgi:molybdopterin-containing oxidoreductase family iron-sulfur binding subunit